MTAHICQWCKKGLGEGGERLENELLLIMGDPVSHGICTECERGLMLMGQDQEYKPCLTKGHIESLMGRT